jgi:hypothetical protein
VSLLRASREAEDETRHDRSRRGSRAGQEALQHFEHFEHFERSSYEREAGRVSLKRIHVVYLDSNIKIA